MSDFWRCPSCGRYTPDRLANCSRCGRPAAGPAPVIPPPPAPTSPRGPIRGEVKYAVGAVVFLLVLAALGRSQGPAAPQDSPAPKAPAVVASPPANTPPPSDAPASTSADDRYLSINKPVATRKPPDAIQEYAGKLARAADDMETALGRLTDASGEASSDPALINDQDWKLRMVVALAGIQIGAEEFEEIQPVPRRVRKAHRLILAAARQYKAASRLIASGLDDGDVDELHSGADRISRAEDLTKQATAEVQEMAGS